MPVTRIFDVSDIHQEMFDGGWLGVDPTTLPEETSAQAAKRRLKVIVGLDRKAVPVEKWVSRPKLRVVFEHERGGKYLYDHRERYRWERRT